MHLHPRLQLLRFASDDEVVNHPEKIFGSDFGVVEPEIAALKIAMASFQEKLYRLMACRRNDSKEARRQYTQQVKEIIECRANLYQSWKMFVTCDLE